MIMLRTYTTFEIWGESIRLARRFFKPLARIILPGVLVISSLAFVVATGIRFESNPMPNLPAISGGSNQQAMLMAAAVPLAGTALLMCILTLLVIPIGIVFLSYRAIEKPLSPGESFQRMLLVLFPLIGSLLLAFVLNGTVAFLGLLIMVVPGPILGLLFYVWYNFVPAVVILEGEGGGGALKRSRALTREFFWKVSALVTTPLVLEFLLVGQTLMFASDVLYGTIGLGLWAPLAILVTMLLLTLLEMVKLIVGMLLYYDLRIHKDGLDIPMLTRELEG